MVPKKSSTNFWTVPFVDSNRVRKISGMDLQQDVKIILKTLLIYSHILVRARHGGFYRAAQMIRPHQVVRLRRSLLSILVIVIITVTTKMTMKLPGREIGQGQVQRHLVADLGDSASLQNPTQGLVRGPL